MTGQITKQKAILRGSYGVIMFVQYVTNLIYVTCYKSYLPPSPPASIAVGYGSL